jgi:hypothetical protein
MNYYIYHAHLVTGRIHRVSIHVHGTVRAGRLPNGWGLKRLKYYEAVDNCQLNMT